MDNRGPSFEPLNPVAFLARAAIVFRDRLAVVDGDLRINYGEFWERCRKLAGLLIAKGAENGARVACIANNSHMLLEAHYAVPMAGAVLVPLNHRLNPKELAFMVEHSGASLLLTDEDNARHSERVLDQVQQRIPILSEGSDLESQIEQAEPTFIPLNDERSLLSINYTSGTTGKPKGVMYHYRGAYLQSLAMALHSRMDSTSIYLWTLPMFHCHGWCFTWAATAVGATHVCLRRIDPEEMWQLIRDEGVTHLNAAPTVLNSLAYHPAAEELPQPQIHVATGGSPPTPSLLNRLKELNFCVNHLYGLTETFGPAVVCEWNPAWDKLSDSEQALLRARQGVANLITERVRVANQDHSDVASDGDTVGEIILRGNNIMLGYYRDDEATDEALHGGWFHTGDLGIMHEDGYVELRDRAKDIIISGGENIASVEIERALSEHPDVLESAVVPVADERWGERPVAFVVLKDGRIPNSGELIELVRSQLAGFKAPSRIEFVHELPKTATGKIQKFELRQRLISEA